MTSLAFSASMLRRLADEKLISQMQPFHARQNIGCSIVERGVSSDFEQETRLSMIPSLTKCYRQ